jgi:hypothetical protein
VIELGDELSVYQYLLIPQQRFNVVAAFVPEVINEELHQQCFLLNRQSCIFFMLQFVSHFINLLAGILHCGYSSRVFYNADSALFT